MTTRRSFLKSCGGTLAIAAAPAWLSQCAAGMPSIRGAFDGHDIVVPKSALAALSNSGGFLLVEASGLPIRIVLRRVGDQGYLALSTVCTHAGCEVRPLPASFQCPCHGSEYDLSGEVLEGPAREPLQKFPVTIREKDLIIKVKI